MLAKILKLLMICVVSMLFVTKSGLCSDSDLKIGVMNLKKIIAVSMSGQAAKAAVTQKFDAYQTKLRNEEKSLVALKDEIEKKASLWSDDIRIKKEREYRRRIQALEEESQFASNDMKNYEQERVGTLLKTLETIIDETGKSGKYTIIIDSAKGVLYHNDAIDISVDLATELDKRHLASK